jgi:hypothetical protein
MKKVLIFLFLFSLGSYSYAQLIKRYCLLPFVEGGLGQSKTLATGGFFNTKSDERPEIGGYISIGLAKQLDDLKFISSIGYQQFNFRDVVTSREKYIDGRRVDYFENTHLFPGGFDTAYWSSTQNIAKLGFVSFSLGVEKNVGPNIIVGVNLKNNFLVRYYDSEDMYYWYGPKVTYLHTSLDRQTRGMRTYQPVVELRSAFQVRREKLKADYGINMMVSLSSATKEIPNTTYLRHIGAYARFFILPKEF